MDEQAMSIRQREIEVGRTLGRLHHVYIRINNPLETYDGGFWDKPIKEAKDKGNDSVIYQNEGEKVGGMSYIPLSKDQIIEIPITKDIRQRVGVWPGQEQPAKQQIGECEVMTDKDGNIIICK
jgi:hypothetical protein